MLPQHLVHRTLLYGEQFSPLLKMDQEKGLLIEQKLEKTMARKAFKGDANYLLPREMIEPYRLWFEYLKTALSDPEISVNNALYRAWGDVENTDFRDWWETHWRKLFALPRLSIQAMDTYEDVQLALSDPDYVVVRIPRTIKIKNVRNDLSPILKNARRGKAKEYRPLFEIDTKRSMRRDILRGMLRLYQLYLENGGEIEKAAEDFLEWAKAWNTKIKDKGWKRDRTFIPVFLPGYVEIVQARREAKASNSPLPNFASYDKLRFQTMRYVDKARKVARNVGNGRFPGEY